MNLGYIRNTTKEQNTDRQFEVFQQHCDKLMVEKVSVNAKKRPVLGKSIVRLGRGVTLVFLDCAIRSTVAVILTAEKLRDRSVSIKILNASIDTLSEWGEVINDVMAIFAKFERKIIKRPTRERFAAAKKAGRKLGRNYKLTDELVCRAEKPIEYSSETVASME